MDAFFLQSNIELKEFHHLTKPTSYRGLVECQGGLSKEIHRADK